MATGKSKKPFVSRKKRKEIVESRAKREQQQFAQLNRPNPSETDRQTRDVVDVALPNQLTVGEFAEKINTPVVQVISQLMKNGILAPVNETIDFDTMAIIGDEFRFHAVPESDEITTNDQPESVIASTSGSILRPAIITVMGHVDHGKTTLLDYIRKAHVADGEHGGITQHIGAYQVEVDHEGKPRLITFLDTPGHEAFTAMRAHGANITDIVILVVAADDGVKPQTAEAVKHAQAANVPIVVAINKMDTPGANPERVKQQLTELELIPEDYGGKTPMLPVSAKTGLGVKELLEMVLLTADIKAPKADPTATPQGVVIEASQQTGLGAVATLLIQNGTLKRGDYIIVGSTYGKIRQLTNDRGQSIESAGPSTPVKVSGLETVPEYGQPFTAVGSTKEAKELTENVGQVKKRSGLQEISRAIAEGRANVLNIVLKADTQGSVDAITYAINGLLVAGAKANIVFAGVGSINESDVMMASATQSLVVGFNVDNPSGPAKTADQRGVTVSTYKIIYDIIDDLTAALKGKVETKMIEERCGAIKIKKIFRSTKTKHVVGGDILDGVAINPAIFDLVRDKEVIGRGEIIGLQKGPEQMSELAAGQEAGTEISISTKPLVGDTIVYYRTKEVIAHTED